MFEPVDAQLGAARRALVEVVRHGDEARDHRLVAPERNRVAAVDRDDLDRRLRAFARRGDDLLQRGRDFARTGIFACDDLACQFGRTSVRGWLCRYVVSTVYALQLNKNN